MHLRGFNCRAASQAGRVLSTPHLIHGGREGLYIIGRSPSHFAAEIEPTFELGNYVDILWEADKARPTSSPPPFL